METVGIRELKAHLSRHLKRVRAGVRLAVTERGRTIATISPVEPPTDVDWAHQLVAEGRARWHQANRLAASSQTVAPDGGINGPRGSSVTLYPDTSSLVKLYVEEKGSPDVRDLVAEAAVVTTSVVAYPDMRAALARLRRSGEFAEQYALRGFDALHLASFAEIARRADTDTRCSSFDDRLNKAARDVARRLSAGA